MISHGRWLLQTGGGRGDDFRTNSACSCPCTSFYCCLSAHLRSSGVESRGWGPRSLRLQSSLKTWCSQRWLSAEHCGSVKFRDCHTTLLAFPKVGRCLGVSGENILVWRTLTGAVRPHGWALLQACQCSCVLYTAFFIPFSWQLGWRLGSLWEKLRCQGKYLFEYRAVYQVSLFNDSLAFYYLQLQEQFWN